MQIRQVQTQNTYHTINLLTARYRYNRVQLDCNYMCNVKRMQKNYASRLNVTEKCIEFNKLYAKNSAHSLIKKQ